MFAVGACPGGQEAVDIGGSKSVRADKRCQQMLIEFNGSFGGSLTAGFDEKG